MKLIFIYGPPATGKLTVAKKLATQTGFKLFHNHLTVDLVTSVIEFGTDSFFALNKKMRLQMFEAAAKQNIKGLLFTICYSNPDDDAFVKETMEIMEKYNAQIHFVHLTCHKNQLKQRVTEESRVDFNKITSVAVLNKSLEEWNFYTPIPFVRSLCIDNTDMSVDDVTDKIVSEYNL